MILNKDFSYFYGPNDTYSPEFPTLKAARADARKHLIQWMKRDKKAGMVWRDQFEYPMAIMEDGYGLYIGRIYATEDGKVWWAAINLPNNSGMSGRAYLIAPDGSLVKGSAKPSAVVMAKWWRV